MICVAIRAIGDVADLGNQRHGARSAGIGFQNINHIVGDGVLDIHQSDDAQFHGDSLGVFFNRIDMCFAGC